MFIVFRVVNYEHSGNKRKLDMKWSTTEFHALSYCVGETCESKTSASSHLGISNMEMELGKGEYAEMKRGQKTPLNDDPDNQVFRKIILPFLKKVRNKSRKCSAYNSRT